MAKKKTRTSREVKPPERILTTADGFAAEHKTHRVPLGGGVVALMLDPTLAQLESFEALCAGDNTTAEDIASLAQQVIVDKAGKQIFETAAAACAALSIGQLHAILAAVEKLKDPASAEKN